MDKSLKFMIILLFIPLLWSNTPVSAQSDDAFLEKYQYYQERFYEDFIYYSADIPFRKAVRFRSNIVDCEPMEKCFFIGLMASGG
jgi:hypothetical protein